MDSDFRVLPDTCVELFINYTSNKIATIQTGSLFDSAGSFLTSRMNTFMDVRLLPRSASIAICFIPGAAWHFFDLPMREITDKNISLADLWGRSVPELEEKIAACANNPERVAMIQSFLLELLQRRHEVTPAYQYSLWQ